MKPPGVEGPKYIEFLVTELLFEVHKDVYKTSVWYRNLRDSLAREVGEGADLGPHFSEMCEAFPDVHPFAQNDFAKTMATYVHLSERDELVLEMTKQPDLHLTMIHMGTVVAQVSTTMFARLLQSVIDADSVPLNHNLARLADIRATGGPYWDETPDGEPIDVIVDWLLTKLGTKAVGRGFKRLDPSKHAVSALRTHLTRGGDAATREHVEQLAAGRGPVANAAKQVLAQD